MAKINLEHEGLHQKLEPQKFVELLQKLEHDKQLQKHEGLLQKLDKVQTDVNELKQEIKSIKEILTKAKLVPYPNPSNFQVKDIQQTKPFFNHHQMRTDTTSLQDHQNGTTTTVVPPYTDSLYDSRLLMLQQQDFVNRREAAREAEVLRQENSDLRSLVRELLIRDSSEMTRKIASNGANKAPNAGLVYEPFGQFVAPTYKDPIRSNFLNDFAGKSTMQESRPDTNLPTRFSAKVREWLQQNREKCPPLVLKVIEEELTKLQMLDVCSREYNITRNHLDWLTALPWGNYSDERFDVIEAKKILDEDHYGSTAVKKRLLQFIAAGKVSGTSQGKIICLSGPPGVGKTSICQSFARALNRKFFRISIGELSNVFEIKGCFGDCPGAMPGKMVQCLKNVGTANPLVLIDGIDKLSTVHIGGPIIALLELLDREQNAKFRDYYLDVPIDLSKVLFVCTANVVDNIAKPLLDRMEVIAVTDEETEIVTLYLEKVMREAMGNMSEQDTMEAEKN